MGTVKFLLVTVNGTTSRFTNFQLTKAMADRITAAGFPARLSGQSARHYNALQFAATREQIEAVIAALDAQR